MQLKDIRDYLKQSGIAEHYAIGKINAKNDKSIGVYSGRRGNEWMKHVGAGNTLQKISAEILIHWNKNAAETDAAAQNVYDFLNKINENEDIMIGNERPMYIKFFENYPIDLGTDEQDIYERYIDFVIYYNETKET